MPSVVRMAAVVTAPLYLRQPLAGAKNTIADGRPFRAIRRQFDVDGAEIHRIELAKNGVEMIAIRAGRVGHRDDGTIFFELITRADLQNGVAFHVDRAAL